MTFFLEIKLKHLLTLACMSMGNFFSTTFAAVLTAGVYLFSIPNVLPTPLIEFLNRALLCLDLDCFLIGPVFASCKTTLWF